MDGLFPIVKSGTTCFRCSQILGEGERFICSPCDLRVVEIQSYYRSESFTAARSAALRDAGISFEMMEMRKPPRVSGTLLEWAGGKRDYLVYVPDGSDAKAIMASRRWDLMAAMYQRIRESRRVHGARIVYAERLSMLDFQRLDQFAEELLGVQLLAIDFPFAASITSHVATRLLAVVSARHWTGTDPSPTLIGFGGDLENETVNQIVALVSSKRPAITKNDPIAGGDDEVNVGKFKQTCFECQRIVMSKYPSSHAWLCKDCARG